MHIAPHDNLNKPIVDADDPTVPLNYFNIVKLKEGEAFHYQVPNYETCIVPATGTVTVEVEGITYTALGGRGVDVWDGHPQGVYIPSGAKATIICESDETETFIAGARYDKVLDPFDVRDHDINTIQTARMMLATLLRPAMTRPIISGSVPTMAPPSRSSNTRKGYPATHSSSWIAPQSFWAPATTPAS